MKKNVRSKLIWALLFVLIMYLSIKAIASQSDEFSLGQVVEMLKGSRKIPLIISLICSISYVVCEGLAILRINSQLGYKRPFHRGMLYAAADVYFSAITPSASGGQPASIYFMVRDGIPGPVATAVLVADLVAYTASILILGAISMIFGFGTFVKFRAISKFLIIVGYILLTGLTVLFYLVLNRVDLLRKVSDFIIGLLEKHNIIKRGRAWRRKLDILFAKYTKCADMMAGEKNLSRDVLIICLVQRASQIAVPAFLWLALCPAGMELTAFRTFFVQCFAVLGSNCMPIPGAMGVIDLLMLDGFNEYRASGTAVKFEILSRSISFYMSVALSLLIVGIGYFSYIIRSKNQAKRI